MLASFSRLAMEPPATTSAVRVLIRPPSSSSSATKTPSIAASSSHADLPPSNPSPPPSAAPNRSSSAPSSPPLPEGVVVVGFVGCGAGDGVAHLINRVLDADVFGSTGLDKDLRVEGFEVGDGQEDWFRHRRISYYYEPEKGIVFLQVSSSAPMSLLGSECSASESGDVRLESFVEERDSEDLRGLLLMFSVCHVIIFLHEGTRFDTHLLKKFRLLQGAKHALVPFIRSHIVSTMVHKAPPFPAKPPVQIKTSFSPGRAGSSRHGSAISLMSGSSSHPSVLPGQCIPVILFVFLDDPLDGPSSMEDVSDSSAINQPSYVTAAPRTLLSSKASTSIVMLSRPMSKTEGSLRKKLQASLETQVRFLIKKCRILSSTESGHPGSRGAGNVYSLPLFSLDASRVVVLLDRSTILGGESLNFVTDIIEQVLSSKGTFDMLESDPHISGNEDIQSIKDFVCRQSDALRGRGSITACTSTSSVAGVGMVAAAAAAAAASAASGKTLSTPELPSLENWLSSTNLILNALTSVKHMLVDDNENMKRIMLQKTPVVAQDEGISGIANNAREAAMSWLESSKGLNMKFSMSWCQRALPVAREIYSKELPACYPTALHRAHLEKALNAFHRMVKGPAAHMFAKRLEEECTSIWETGRQLCDAISLTGKPCMHQRHHVKAGGPQSEKGSKKHSSGFVFRHACSCGRSRRLRDDPFDFESANVTFSCFPNCEGLLPSLVLPEGRKTEPVHSFSWNLIRLGGARYYDPLKGLLQSGFCSNENFLLKWTISLERYKGLNIDSVQNLPTINSPKDPKVVITEEIDETNPQLGTSENDQRKSSKNVPTESTISFGKGLPSFVMKKAFSEVVAGTAVLDSKVSLLQQKKQPKVPAEKDVKHRTENDITNDQVHVPNGGQELRRTAHISIQQGLQTSFHINALQIGSNVVPVNMDHGKKTKTKGFLKQVSIYIGFEHECPHGHRFLLSTEHLKELGSSYSLPESSHFHPAQDSSGRFAKKSADMNILKEGPHKKISIHSGGKISPVSNMRRKNKLIEVVATPNQHYLEKENNQPGPRENLNENCFLVRLDDGSSAFSLLNRKLPLYMNCPHCLNPTEKEQKFKFASTVSQLQRIFLVTPPFPFVLATCPIIQFEDSCLPPSVLDREQQSQFSPGCPIVLPPESFLAFRLPFIYGVQLDDGSLEPLRHFEHQPELTAWLAKGTALQLMSKEFNFIDDFNIE